MLPQHLYAVFLGFLVDPLASARAYVRATQLPSFLSNTVARTEQVQNVLQHQPAKDPTCKQYVRSAMVRLHAANSNQFLANRPHRDYTLRL